MYFVLHSPLIPALQASASGGCQKATKHITENCNTRQKVETSYSIQIILRTSDFFAMTSMLFFCLPAAVFEVPVRRNVALRQVFFEAIEVESSQGTAQPHPVVQRAAVRSHEAGAAVGASSLYPPHHDPTTGAHGPKRLRVQHDSRRHEAAVLKCAYAAAL